MNLQAIRFRAQRSNDRRIRSLRSENRFEKVRPRFAERAGLPTKPLARFHHRAAQRLNRIVSCYFRRTMNISEARKNRQKATPFDLREVSTGSGSDRVRY